MAPHWEMPGTLKIRISGKRDRHGADRVLLRVGVVKLGLEPRSPVAEQLGRQTFS